MHKGRPKPTLLQQPSPPQAQLTQNMLQILPKFMRTPPLMLPSSQIPGKNPFTSSLTCPPQSVVSASTGVNYYNIIIYILYHSYFSACTHTHKANDTSEMTQKSWGSGLPTFHFQPPGLCCPSLGTSLALSNVRVCGEQRGDQEE